MRKRRVPIILQMETSECGAASLAMVLAYYGRNIPLEKMRIDCNVSRDGCSAKYIVLAAKKHGMDAKGYRVDAESLKDGFQLPAIIHWQFNHFVVLTEVKKNGVILNDPAEGEVFIDWGYFKKSFTGVAITLSPGENFEELRRDNAAKGLIHNNLGGLLGGCAMMMATGLIYSACAIFPPIFYKIFTDRIMIYNDEQWLVPLVVSMCILGLAMFSAGCFRNYFIAKLRVRFCIRNSMQFVWKVLRLPEQFFVQRYNGDIVSRMEDSEELAESLFDKLLPSMMDMVLSVNLLAVIFYFDYRIAVVMFTAGMLQALAIILTSHGNHNVARSVKRDGGKAASAMMSGISMIETIKSCGVEAATIERVIGNQTNYNNSLQELTRNKLYLGILPGFLAGLCNAVVIVIGIYAVFSGRETVGMLVALQSIVQIFFEPIGAAAECIRARQEMAGNRDRINDIILYEEDVTEEDLFGKNKLDGKKLTGDIEIKNVTFGYSPVAEPLIKDFSLHIKKGQKVAFVGSSGSGKSTLASLLSNMYKPDKGEILFDGMPAEEINKYVFTSSVAAVDQMVSLFSETVFNNISMWNPNIKEGDVYESCSEACIHGEILRRNEGYGYIMNEDGCDFSGGQRQRFDIARALAVNPTILILDEATSALDNRTERKIMESVRERNITCIVIAHRLSTVRDADVIVVLDKGVVAEKGTHDELMKKNGLYARLALIDRKYEEGMAVG